MIDNEIDNHYHFMYGNQYTP